LIGESFGALVGGGSLLTMPALLFTGIPLQAAIATDNAAALGTEAGILSETYKKVLANKKLTLLMAAPLTLGGIVGTWLLFHVPGGVIKYLMVATITVLVVHSYFSKGKTDPNAVKRSHYVLMMIFLFLVGAYSNFMAAGEGAFSRFGLMTILGLSFMQSQGIKATATMPSRIYSLIVTGIAGLIIWPYLLTMWCSTFLAGKYATKLAKHIPDNYMKIALTVVSILFAIYLLFFYKQ
ncbi:MAG: sulfite exporter TauE/SafE family protein, partial [Candidatus Saccharimonadales bacterium]